MATKSAGFALRTLWDLSNWTNIAMNCCTLLFLYLDFHREQKTFDHCAHGS